MNPNPYRTTLLVFAGMGLVVGLIVFLAAATSSDLSVVVAAGTASTILFSIGATSLALWLIVSAIIYGLSPRTAPAPTASTGHWLSNPPAAEAETRQPPTDDVW